MAGGVFSGAKLNGMTIRESANDGSDFTNPDADYRRLFLGEDGSLYTKDSAGTVTAIGGGSGIPPSILDAKGDIIAASAADTAARLAVGANGKSLVAASGESTGLLWAFPVGSIIALVAYAPGTPGSYTTTTTLADMDATNLAIAFTVPTTANVLLRFTCQAFNSASTGVLLWGIRESTTTITEAQVASPEGESAGNIRTISRTFYVTGLTPGASLTYKWAARHVTNSWTNRWSDTAGIFGAATMEVIVAP